MAPLINMKILISDLESARDFSAQLPIKHEEVYDELIINKAVH